MSIRSGTAAGNIPGRPRPPELVSSLGKAEMEGLVPSATGSFCTAFQRFFSAWLSAGPWRCKTDSALGLDSKMGRYHRAINKVPRPVASQAGSRVLWVPRRGNDSFCFRAEVICNLGEGE